MRYPVLLVIGVFLALFSCKLMPKKEPTNDKEKNMSNEIRRTDWRHHTNIYEVNVRQYTPEGTFNAFAKEMPRLKDMGVQVLWFMPITPIAQKGRKGSLGSPYACSDYTSINPEFGTLDDFKKLVSEAHALGFKVIIDWVANHTGWDHRWTKEHPDYYLKDSATNDFQIASGMDDIIELDYHNPALRKAMIDAMKYWISECDIDGFRCDLAAWVELDFWQEARPQVDALKPLFWLGEFDEIENPGYGKVFDASYSWKWMHATRHFYQEHLPLDTLTTLLAKYSSLGDSSMRAWFTSNHDENTWNGTEYEKYGNMAHSLAVFSCTWNGVPLIYSGQELPLQTKRLAFFEKDPIPWTGKNELHSFYKTLLHLHSSHPALSGGDAAVETNRVMTTDTAHVFAFLRKKENKEVLVILNWSYTAGLKFSITDPRVKGQFRDVFSGQTVDMDKNRELTFDAWGYQVLER